jgi:hypothetical protein
MNLGFLDDVPMATLTFIAGLVLTVIAYVSDDLTVLEAFGALGLTGGASAGIGHARNGAGRGVRK